MPVVLDPNVLVSAALSAAGAPAQLVRRWLDGEFELLVSPALLEELGRVLAYPKIAERISRGHGAELIDLLEDQARAVNDPAEASTLTVDDPGDEYLVALALEFGAALVSGDKHLLILSDRLPVYSPRVFLEGLDRGSPGS